MKKIWLILAVGVIALGIALWNSGALMGAKEHGGSDIKEHGGSALQEHGGSTLKEHGGVEHAGTTLTEATPSQRLLEAAKSLQQIADQLVKLSENLG